MVLAEEGMHVYEGDGEAIRAYMLRTGMRLLDLFNALDLDTSHEITKQGFGDAIRTFGLAQATDAEIDLTWQRLTGTTTKRLSNGGLRTHLKRTGQRVTDLFSSLDLDGSRDIDAVEFARALRRIGFIDATDAEVSELWGQLDADGNGRLDLGELDKRLMDVQWIKGGAPRAAEPEEEQQSPRQ